MTNPQNDNKGGNSGLNRPCEEKFGALFSQSMSLETGVMGNAGLLKMLIETGQKPSDETIIQILQTIYDAARTHRDFRESLREPRKPE